MPMRIIHEREEQNMTYFTGYNVLPTCAAAAAAEVDPAAAYCLLYQGLIRLHFRD